MRLRSISLLFAKTNPQHDYSLLVLYMLLSIDINKLLLQLNPIDNYKMHASTHARRLETIMKNDKALITINILCTLV